jgi:hypothetical protein
LVQALGLSSIPDFSTLQMATVCLLEAWRAQWLMDHAVSMAQEAGLLGRRSNLAARDLTGLESTTVSRYFARYRERRDNNRIWNTYSVFP